MAGPLPVGLGCREQTATGFEIPLISMAVSFLAYKPSPYRNTEQHKLGQLQLKRRKLKALGLELGYKYVKIRQTSQVCSNRMPDYM
jgi:hypothetical protein